MNVLGEGYSITVHALGLTCGMCSAFYPDGNEPDPLPDEERWCSQQNSMRKAGQRFCNRGVRYRKGVKSAPSKRSTSSQPRRTENSPTIGKDDPEVERSFRICLFVSRDDYNVPKESIRDIPARHTDKLLRRGKLIKDGDGLLWIAPSQRSRREQEWIPGERDALMNLGALLTKTAHIADKRKASVSETERVKDRYQREEMFEAFLKHTDPNTHIVDFTAAGFGQEDALHLCLSGLDDDPPRLFTKFFQGKLVFVMLQEFRQLVPGSAEQQELLELSGKLPTLALPRRLARSRLGKQCVTAARKATPVNTGQPAKKGGETQVPDDLKRALEVVISETTGRGRISTEGVRQLEAMDVSVQAKVQALGAAQHKPKWGWSGKPGVAKQLLEDTKGPEPPTDEATTPEPSGAPDVPVSDLSTAALNSCIEFEGFEEQIFADLPDDIVSAILNASNGIQYEQGVGLRVQVAATVVANGAVELSFMDLDPDRLVPITLSTEAINAQLGRGRYIPGKGVTFDGIATISITP